MSYEFLLPRSFFLIAHTSFLNNLCDQNTDAVAILINKHNVSGVFKTVMYLPNHCPVVAKKEIKTIMNQKTLDTDRDLMVLFILATAKITLKG